MTELTNRMRVEKAKLEDFRTTRDPIYIARNYGKGHIGLWQVTGLYTDDGNNGQRVTSVRISNGSATENVSHDGLEDCVFRLYDVPLPASQSST